MSVAYNRVCDALREAGCVVVERAGRATAQAPGHSPADRSVSIAPADRYAGIVIHSHSDPIENVLDAIGLGFADLYDEPRVRGAAPTPRPLTAEQLERKAKRAEMDAAHKAELDAELAEATRIAAETLIADGRKDPELVDVVARRLTEATDPLDKDADPLDEDESPYAPLDWTKLLTGTIEPTQWLIPLLIAAGRLYALVSAAKAGKSLLVLQQIITHGVRTLYLDAEQTQADLRGRLTAMGATPDELDSLVYLLYPPLAPLDTAAGGAQLLALIEQHQPELVVIDTLSRFVAGDENESTTYQALYRNTLVHLKRAGVAVLRLDHLGKDTTKGQRGSSAKNDDVDAVWVLTEKHAGTNYVLRCERQRSGDHPQYIEVTRKTDPLRHELAAGGVAQVEELAPILSIVAELDELDIPVAWGRDRVRAAYGKKVRNEHLNEAINVRRQRFTDTTETGRKPVPDRSAELSPQKAVPSSGDSSDISAGRTRPGQVGDSLGGVPQATCPRESPPIGGDRTAGTKKKRRDHPLCDVCSQPVTAGQGDRHLSCTTTEGDAR